MDVFHKETQKSTHRLDGCARFYKHHRSSISTLPLGRKLYGQRACPSRTLYGVIMITVSMAAVNPGVGGCLQPAVSMGSNSETCRFAMPVAEQRNAKSKALILPTERKKQGLLRPQ